MPRFSYHAIQETGQRIAGTLNAGDRQDVLRQLLNQGYHPLSVDFAEDGRGAGGSFTSKLFHRVSRTDLAVFTRQLSSLLKAGLPVIQALATQHQQCANPRLARRIQEIEEKITRDGGTLTEALEDHPTIFDPVYRGLVRSGEEGGDLVTVLSGLAQHLSRSAQLRRQVLGAFIYPLFLLILGATAVFVLMTFVIPRFQELFESFGAELPGPTRILIAVSGFLAAWWWAIPVGLLALILLILAALRQVAVRTRFDRVLLALPVLGAMFLKLEIARISRTLAALLAGGVPILEALRITADTVKNFALKATFDPLIQGVSTGEGLAGTMAKSHLYPPLVLNLVRTGEETGELPELLVELSDIYEDESERAVTGAVKLLEPVLICLMGGVIAAIVAAVILPIFRANIMTT